LNHTKLHACFKFILSRGWFKKKILQKERAQMMFIHTTSIGVLARDLPSALKEREELAGRLNKKGIIET